MKAVFQYGLASMTGRNGEIVYCLNRQLNRVYVRRYVYPTLVENHHNMGSISKHIFGLQPSAGYIDDMKLYLFRYRSLRIYGAKQISAWSILYNKLMRDMAKVDPSINLMTITRDEIYARDLPCISVKKAVEAGLLPEVYGYEDINSHPKLQARLTWTSGDNAL